MMVDKNSPINHAAEIAGLKIAVTVLIDALLSSCAIDKKKMLETIDKHCAHLSHQLLEADEKISVADRLLLDIRTLVVEHMKQH